MRKTKKQIVFTILQVLFSAVVPLVFFFCQYGMSRAGLGYKLPLGVLLLCVVLLWIAKSTLLKPRIMRLSAKIAQHEGDLSVEANQDKIHNLEMELRRERVLETVFNAIMPFLILAGMLVLCKALESAVLVLSGAVGFTLASFVLGTVFGVLAAREVHGKHSAKEITDNE